MVIQPWITNSYDDIQETNALI
nr:unnamed protein product [Callosobruchus analis]